MHFVFDSSAAAVVAKLAIHVQLRAPGGRKQYVGPPSTRLRRPT